VVQEVSEVPESNMTRSKSHRGDEDLKGMLREARSQIKALKRRLRQLEKNKHLWEENKLDDSEPEEFQEVKLSNCPDCKKGFLKNTDLNIKILITCTLCDYRKITNKI